MSRTVAGEWLLDDVAKEVLRRQLWQVADYCGIQIVTYAILSNHFHVLVRIPGYTPPSDAELLRRYHGLYPRPTKYQTARFEVVENELADNGPEAVNWRRRQLALMGDISPFMKLLKQRFSIWFNKAHHRFGTLWAERFKSVLVEGEGWGLRTMATYIDLNSVRAGLVVDPKDYRFCGYAEAVAGVAVAQSGIRFAMGEHGWEVAHARYRELIFGTGAKARASAAIISPPDLRQVVTAGGKLPLAVVLRCRLRFFTDGAVLGSRAFVEMHLARYRWGSKRRMKIGPHALPPATDWGDLTTLRGLRRQARPG